MKLPKRDLPRYDDVLPISGEKYTFRPYTIKEEKILMMSAAGSDGGDKVSAIKQVVGNCTNVNVDTVHPTDLEWAFLQLRKTSVSSLAEVMYTPLAGACGISPEEKRPCPKEFKAVFDIATAKTRSDIDINDVATPAKGGGWLLNVGDDLLFHMDVKVPDGDHSPLYQMLRSVIDGDNVIPKEDFSEEEFLEFMEDCLLPSGMAKIFDFVNSSPYTVATVEARCPTCRKSFSYEATGIIGFLV